MMNWQTILKAITLVALVAVIIGCRTKAPVDAVVISNVEATNGR